MVYTVLCLPPRKSLKNSAQRWGSKASRNKEEKYNSKTKLRGSFKNSSVHLFFFFLDADHSKLENKINVIFFTSFFLKYFQIFEMDQNLALIL